MDALAHESRVVYDQTCFNPKDIKQLIAPWSRGISLTIPMRVYKPNPRKFCDFENNDSGIRPATVFKILFDLLLEFAAHLGKHSKTGKYFPAILIEERVVKQSAVEEQQSYDDESNAVKCYGSFYLDEAVASRWGLQNEDIDLDDFDSDDEKDPSLKKSADQKHKEKVQQIRKKNFNRIYQIAKEIKDDKQRSDFVKEMTRRTQNKIRKQKIEDDPENLVARRWHLFNNMKMQESNEFESFLTKIIQANQERFARRGEMLVEMHRRMEGGQFAIDIGDGDSVLRPHHKITSQDKWRQLIALYTGQPSVTSIMNYGSSHLGSVDLGNPNLGLHVVMAIRGTSNDALEIQRDIRNYIDPKRAIPNVVPVGDGDAVNVNEEVTMYKFPCPQYLTIIPPADLVFYFKIYYGAFMHTESNVIESKREAFKEWMTAMGMPDATASIPRNVSTASDNRAIMDAIGPSVVADERSKRLLEATATIHRINLTKSMMRDVADAQERDQRNRGPNTGIDIPGVESSMLGEVAVSMGVSADIPNLALSHMASIPGAEGANIYRPAVRSNLLPNALRSDGHLRFNRTEFAQANGDALERKMDNLNSSLQEQLDQDPLTDDLLNGDEVGMPDPTSIDPMTTYRAREDENTGDVVVTCLDTLRTRMLQMEEAILRQPAVQQDWEQYDRQRRSLVTEAWSSTSIITKVHRRVIEYTQIFLRERAAEVDAEMSRLMETRKNLRKARGLWGLLPPFELQKMLPETLRYLVQEHGTNTKKILEAIDAKLKSPSVANLSTPWFYTVKNLSVFCNFMHDKHIDTARRMFCVNQNRAMMLTHYAAMDASRHSFGLHCNSLLTGPYASSKSFNILTTKENLIPGTWELVTHMTTQSQSTHGEDNDKVWFFEEMPGGIIGIEGHQNSMDKTNSMQATIVKNQLTSQKNTTHAYSERIDRVTGEKMRVSKKSVKQIIGVIIGAFNRFIDKVRPEMLSRFTYTATRQLQSDEASILDVITKKMTHPIFLKCRNEKRASHIQMYATNKLIQAGILKEPTMFVPLVLLRQYFDGLTERGMKPDTRMFELHWFFIRNVCIDWACHMHYNSPLSPIINKPWNIHQHLGVSSWMFATEDMTLYVMGLLSDFFCPPTEEFLFEKLRSMKRQKKLTRAHEGQKSFEGAMMPMRKRKFFKKKFNPNDIQLAGEADDEGDEEPDERHVNKDYYAIPLSENKVEFIKRVLVAGNGSSEAFTEDDYLKLFGSLCKRQITVTDADNISDDEDSDWEQLDQDSSSDSDSEADQPRDEDNLDERIMMSAQQQARPGDNEFNMFSKSLPAPASAAVPAPASPKTKDSNEWTVGDDVDDQFARQMFNAVDIAERKQLQYRMNNPAFALLDEITSPSTASVSHDDKSSEHGDDEENDLDKLQMVKATQAKEMNHRHKMLEYLNKTHPRDQKLASEVIMQIELKRKQAEARREKRMMERNAKKLMNPDQKERYIRKKRKLRKIKRQQLNEAHKNTKRKIPCMQVFPRCIWIAKAWLRHSPLRVVKTTIKSLSHAWTESRRVIWGRNTKRVRMQGKGHERAPQKPYLFETIKMKPNPKGKLLYMNADFIDEKIYKYFQMRSTFNAMTIPSTGADSNDFRELFTKEFSSRRMVVNGHLDTVAWIFHCQQHRLDLTKYTYTHPLILRDVLIHLQKDTHSIDNMAIYPNDFVEDTGKPDAYLSEAMEIHQMLPPDVMKKLTEVFPLNEPFQLTEVSEAMQEKQKAIKKAATIKLAPKPQLNAPTTKKQKTEFEPLQMKVDLVPSVVKSADTEKPKARTILSRQTSIASISSDEEEDPMSPKPKSSSKSNTSTKPHAVFGTTDLSDLFGPDEEQKEDDGSHTHDDNASVTEAKRVAREEALNAATKTPINDMLSSSTFMSAFPSPSTQSQGTNNLPVPFSLMDSDSTSPQKQKRGRSASHDSEENDESISSKKARVGGNTMSADDLPSESTESNDTPFSFLRGVSIPRTPSVASSSSSVSSSSSSSSSSRGALAASAASASVSSSSSSSAPRSFSLRQQKRPLAPTSSQPLSLSSLGPIRGDQTQLVRDQETRDMIHEIAFSMPSTTQQASTARRTQPTQQQQRMQRQQQEQQRQRSAPLPFHINQPTRNPSTEEMAILASTSRNLQQRKNQLSKESQFQPQSPFRH